MNNKILDFKHFKGQVEKKDYYSVLSFSQLINEAYDAIEKMGREEKANTEAMNDTRLLLLEFIHRLDKISSSYSESLHSLKGQVEGLLK